jgi:hypothetical protein
MNYLQLSKKKNCKGLWLLTESKDSLHYGRHVLAKHAVHSIHPCGHDGRGPRSVCDVTVTVSGN